MDEDIQASIEVGDDEFDQYLDMMSAALRRTAALIKSAKDAPSETSDDTLRAAVVLLHAYLEDFLRTVARVHLPNADEATLNRVPLAGTGRAREFKLGALTRHRGHSVDEVIDDSVSEYLEQKSFSDITDIMVFLDSLGGSVKVKDVKLVIEDSSKASVDVPANPKTVVAVLGEMIKRRHQIVHCADRAKNGKSLSAIEPVKVFEWTTAAMMFMISVTGSATRMTSSQKAAQSALIRALTE
jgi:hypothetical protein